jgi:GTP-binding protein
VALNKIDIPDGRVIADMVEPMLAERGIPAFAVSAMSREGLRPLMFAMAQAVAAHRASVMVDTATRIVINPKAVDDSGFSIVTEADAETQDILYRVVGHRPERWVRQTDFSNEEAVGYLGERLARLGVEKSLWEAGARAGSTVLIGPLDSAVVFDWEPTIALGGS